MQFDGGKSNRDKWECTRAIRDGWAATNLSTSLDGRRWGGVTVTRKTREKGVVYSCMEWLSQTGQEGNCSEIYLLV